MCSMKFYPRQYQREAIQFILQHNACGVLLDIGMGKTVIALTAMQKLLYDYFVSPKILIVTSKVLAENIWIKELKKWDHLCELKYSIIMGKEKERNAAIRKPADIYITNAENISWFIQNDLWIFDTLILDEFYRCKNEKSKYFANLMQLRPRLKRIIGLTAMPIANELPDIWALAFLLDGGERLGRNKAGFCERYFFKEWRMVDKKYQLCKEAKRGAKEAIYDAIKDIFYCREANDLHIPCIYKDFCIEMSPSEYSKYYWLESNMLYPADDKSTDTHSSIEILSKLLQAANGIWTDDVQDKYVFHERKLAALNRIVQSGKGQRILVACWFLKDKECILKQYPEVSVLNSAECVKKWNQGEGNIGIINPASNEAKMQLAKGTDILVWYSLPWSLEIYKKLNARITDDKSNKIVIHIIMMATIEEKLLLLLRKKQMRQDEMLTCLSEMCEEGEADYECCSDNGDDLLG